MGWVAGSDSKKTLKLNFLNVILAYQTWVRRHYIVMLLERSIRKGLFAVLIFLLYF